MKTCPQCKQVMPADAPSGVCPACMLGLARAANANQALQVTRDNHDREEPQPLEPTELAKLFPQLQVRELVGQGGMGAVYKAYQPNLDRDVALKIMSSRLADDPSFAERFSREAKTLARLNHQNIVNVFDFGQVGDVYYLMMEFVDGVNLRQAMKDGQLNAGQALTIVPQVCEALQFAHDEGIIHRDIKPENILLDRKGRVKIADFGLAKLTQSSAQQWTLTGSRQVLGTLNYMAPEQIERPTEVDHRADIYSLGVVLYELLTGELPLGRFPMPSEKNTGSAELDQVVLRSLAKEPNRRYQQASEVKSAVEAAHASGFEPIPPNPNRVGVQSPLPAAYTAAPVPDWTPHRDASRLRVPFTITEQQMGLAKTYGVMRIQPQHLEVDYSLRENIFKTFQLKSGQHAIDFSLIVSADYRTRFFTDRLDLVLDRPQGLSGLPSNAPGRLEFQIAREHRDDARQLVNAIRLHTKQAPLVGFRPAGKPKTPLQEAKRSVGWPAMGLITAGAVNLIAAPLLTIMLMFTGSSKLIPNLPFDSDIFEVVIPGVLFLTWFVLGMMLFLGGVRMLAMRSHRWCMAMSVLAMLPVHPGALLGLPSGIWALAVLAKGSVQEQFS